MMKKLHVLFPVLTGVVLATVVVGCGADPSIPDTPEACLRQASESAGKGDWKRTLKLTDRMAELEPDNTDVLVFNAIAALRCGESERAYAAASKAVKLSPGSFIAQYTLGRVCMSSPAHKGEAMGPLFRALKLRHGDRDTLVSLCNLVAEVASPNDLFYLNNLKSSAEFAESPELYNQLALAYLHHRDIAGARRSLIRAWHLGRENIVINYNAGCFFDRHTMEIPVALKFYRKYMELSKNVATEAARRSEVDARIAALEGKR